MVGSGLKYLYVTLMVAFCALCVLGFSTDTSVASTSRDKIRSTYMALMIRADLNRDGEIDFIKSDALQGDYTDNSSPSKPYRFWINNDYDVVNNKGGIFHSMTSCNAWNPNAKPGEQYQQTCEQWDENPNGLITKTNTNSSDRLRRIETYRDLEDFTPLAIRLGSNEMGEKYFLKLTAKGVSINIFKGIWKKGEKAHSYVYDATKTKDQIDSSLSRKGYVGALNPSDDITLNTADVRHYFDEDGVARFIFEGVEATADDCNQGSKDCYVSVGFYRKNTISGKVVNALLAEDRLYINLYDVEDLYESITAGDASEGDLFDYDAKYFGLDAIAKTKEIKASLFQDIERESDINKYYILLVHGWRMTEYEKRSFAQTAFKRLYWSGYKGRFGAFNWPTGWFNRDAHVYMDTGAMHLLQQILEIAGNNQHYDISESVARRVGRDLIQKLQDGILHPANAYHVFAHSMGNVVVSEAIRHDNPANPFFTSYSPSQAATVSGAYKQDQQIITHKLMKISELGCTNNEVMTPEAAWRCYNSDNGGAYDMPPDLYRFNLAVDDNGSWVIRHGPTTDDAMNALVGTGKKSYYDGLYLNLKEGRIVNYFNRVDAALSTWEFNQLTRPDTPNSWKYTTISFADDIVTSQFKDTTTYHQLQWSDQITKDSANILSRFIPARTNALGQSEIVDPSIGVRSQNLEFTDSNQDHSAQFHGYYSELSPYSNNNTAVRAVYWNMLLDRSVRLLTEDYSGLKNGLE